MEPLSPCTGRHVTITASQGGNDTYLAAADATQSLTVKDDRYLDQNITWTQTISGLTIGASNVSMTAKSIDADSGADTNLTISYASSNTAVATVVSGNSLQIVGAGSATITASQAGNVSTGGRYNAATSVTKSISVGKASQTIVTNAGATTLPNLTKDNGDFPFVPAIKSVDCKRSRHQPYLSLLEFQHLGDRDKWFKPPAFECGHIHHYSEPTRKH